MTWERHAQERLRSYYDMIAAEYDWKYQNAQLVYMRRVERELLEQHLCEGKVLDVGCGTGNQVLWLARRGNEVIGLDISPTIIQIARKKITREGLGGQVSFIVGDAGHLPFREEIFDSLISILGTYNHVSNVEEGFTEMRRVLKRNGKVVATIINKWSWIQWLKAIWKRATQWIGSVSRKSKALLSFKTRKGRVYLWTYYFSSGALRKLLTRREFTSYKTGSLMILVPPKYEHDERPMPRLLRLLATLEDKIRWIFPFNHLGEFLILLSTK